MPNIKSAKKRVKVIAVKTARNKANRSALRTEVKKANAALETGVENKEEILRIAMKKIDQAAAKGLLHKNTAARRKSALAKKAHALMVFQSKPSSLGMRAFWQEGDLYH